MPALPLMRALVLERPAGPFVLSETPLPTIAGNQALVRIKASGVNPLDTKIRAGRAAHARVKLPAILGMDLAGVVEAVGPEVRGLTPGNEVYGFAGGIGELQGTLATFAAVDADLLARKPVNFSMREAQPFRSCSSRRGRDWWIAPAFMPGRRYGPCGSWRSGACCRADRARVRRRSLCHSFRG